MEQCAGPKARYFPLSIVALSLVARKSGKGASNFLFCKEKTRTTKITTILKMVIPVHFRIFLNSFMFGGFGGLLFLKLLGEKINHSVLLLIFF